MIFFYFGIAQIINLQYCKHTLLCATTLLFLFLFYSIYFYSYFLIQVLLMYQVYIFSSVTSC